MSNYQNNNDINNLLMECINLTREQQQNYNNNFTNIINVINRIIDENNSNSNSNTNNINIPSISRSRLRRNNQTSPFYDPNNSFRINTIYSTPPINNPSTNTNSSTNNLITSLFQTLLPSSEIGNEQVNSDIHDVLFRPVTVRPTEQQITNATEDVSFNELVENNVLQYGDTCPIDLEPLTENDQLIRIQRCGHIFRKNNLIQWFTTNVRCPLCRIDIRESSSSE